MSERQPFRVDATATAAFEAISDDALRIGLMGGNRAVVIGGGTGAPMSIRALLTLGMKTSAVVAMADDGGSTGVLRKEANVTPPGDIRKCIAAMAADPDDPMTVAFKTRFDFGQQHSLGNLLLAALEDATGSFPEAILVCERILNCRGHVFPSTLDRVKLFAETRDGQHLEGQAVANHSDCALKRVSLRFNGAGMGYEPALDHIRRANLIVLGPGSLYTSIIPNLLVAGVIDAIRESGATVVYVCSLVDVQGETRGMGALDYVRALYDHGMEGLIDYVFVHTKEHLQPGMSDAAEPEPLGPNALKPVRVTYEDAVAIQKSGPMVIARDFADEEHPSWHNPRALRNALWEVFQRCHSLRM